ncbi:FAD:protein FMN transferase [Pseudomonas stutzeri]|uniref:FAD:protein FMN transferase n=1 Tax=Stutzerimonas stutzeri TaxID=316 RepID=UPI00210BF28A|nr:FAD:protein FMN transferase [Stutzerimonas stutzeri]MCQ4307441.1 FAD:protein FMN transferase [Stutzerimonas stutzeri]
MNHALLQPVIVATLAAALTGCLFQDKVESFGGPTMGSTYSVKYVAGDQAANKAQLQRDTESILAEIDKQMSTYRSDSDIEVFNALPAGECMTMPSGVRELVVAGQRLSEESDGALDLTIEPLLNLWGFGPQGRGERVPSAEEIARVRQDVGQQHLRVEGEQLCKVRAVQVDFNSIAAGYAVDQVAETLEASGVSSYLVEITGELKARGHKPDGAPWRIAIEAPHDAERVAQRIIELDGYAVSTSGDYRNYFERDGKRYSHTLDPQTGVPIDHHLAAVTVVDPSTLRADGLSTVLMVLGPERGLAYAAEHKIAALFVIREGQKFVSRSTEAFDELFGAGVEQ